MSRSAINAVMDTSHHVLPAGCDPDTWFHEPKFRKFSWRHLHRVTPSATLSVANAQAPQPWQDIALQNELLQRTTCIIDHERYPQAGTPVSGREIFNQMHGEALAVLHRDTLVLRHETDLTMDQTHAWMSISKLLTNALLGHLVWQYNLDLNRPIGDFLGDVLDPDLATVPLQQFADMDVITTSNENDYQDPSAPFWPFGAAVGWFSDKHYAAPSLNICQISNVCPRQPVKNPKKSGIPAPIHSCWDGWSNASSACRC